MDESEYNGYVAGWQLTLADEALRLQLMNKLFDYNHQQARKGRYFEVTRAYKTYHYYRVQLKDLDSGETRRLFWLSTEKRWRKA